MMNKTAPQPSTEIESAKGTNANLSPEDERRLLEAKDLNKIRIYVQTHSMDKENICFIITQNMPQDIIESLIKQPKGIPACAQIALLKQNSYELLKVCAEYQHLADELIKEILIHGDDSLLEFYLQTHPLSPEMQQWLIKAHKIELIRLHIEKYGLCKEAELTFLEFMKDRLKR